MVTEKLKEGASANTVGPACLACQRCLWSHICATDMPFWSKGRDGRCRAERQIGLRLGRRGARQTGCRPVLCTALQRADFPLKLYVPSWRSGQGKRESGFVSACDKSETAVKTMLLLPPWLHSHQQRY